MHPGDVLECATAVSVVGVFIFVVVGLVRDDSDLDFPSVSAMIARAGSTGVWVATCLVLVHLVGVGAFVLLRWSRQSPYFRFITMSTNSLYSIVLLVAVCVRLDRNETLHNVSATLAFALGILGATGGIEYSSMSCLAAFDLLTLGAGLAYTLLFMISDNAIPQYFLIFLLLIVRKLKINLLESSITNVNEDSLPDADV
jgi:hypothetical protein